MAADQFAGIWMISTLHRKNADESDREQQNLKYFVIELITGRRLITVVILNQLLL
jgi:hypothetical protein